MSSVITEASTEGISIDRIVRDSPYTMTNSHFHNEYEIYYLAEGERYYFIEDRTYYIHKGCIVLIGRSKIHKTAQVGSSYYHDRYLIELKNNPISSILSVCDEINLDELFDYECCVYELDIDGIKYVEKLLNDIANEISKKDSCFNTVAVLKITELLIYVQRLNHEIKHINRELAVSSQIHKQINNISQYIASNFTENISLSSIAERFYLSKSYLSRKYKEITGFSITEYINIKRIKYAQELLADESINITNISSMVGYNSITYFEKVFQNCTGHTPRQYRRNLQEFLRPVRPENYYY